MKNVMPNFPFRPEVAKDITSPVFELAGNTYDRDYTVNELYEMIRQYNDILVDRGFGLSKKVIKKKDQINMIPICEYKNKSQIAGTPEEFLDERVLSPILEPNAFDDDFFNENGWYSEIPCFREGVFRLNICRYLYWKINELDIEAKTIDVFLQDYCFDHGIWNIGTSARVVLDYKACDLKNEIGITIKDHSSSLDLYRAISYDDLGWNENQIYLWEKMILPYTPSDQKASCNDLIVYFRVMTGLANQALWKNKPKAVRSKQSPSGKRIVAPRDEKDAEMPKKIIRKVGAIEMRSEKPPRLPSRETVVKYKVASWKCRGGVRRLKSGKVVPFKESIKHRKCLAGNNDVPQTILEIHGER